MSSFSTESNFLGSIAPAQILQAFFIISASSVLLVATLPSEARGLLTNYGARSTSAVSSSPTAKILKPKNSDIGQSDGFTKLVSMLTSHGQIPHRWFIHFYIFSVSCSLFWLYQHVCFGRALRVLAERQSKNAGPEAGMSLSQVFLTWGMMFAQGIRRLYEDLYVTRPSKSPMWIVHWLLALSFYGSMSVSVWIEGSGSILASKPGRIVEPRSMPMFKVTLGSLLFLYGWFMQHQCHKHLANLIKYSLPSEGMFGVLLCPHYTCDCLIYLGMAIAAAPPGNMLNKTLLCALVFVAVNLGVTANGTKRWYEGRFGEDRVATKWKMIPWLF